MLGGSSWRQDRAFCMGHARLWPSLWLGTMLTTMGMLLMGLLMRLGLRGYCLVEILFYFIWHIFDFICWEIHPVEINSIKN